MMTMDPDNRAHTIIGRALKMFIINPGNKCPEANSISKCLSPKGEFEVCSEANFDVIVKRRDKTAKKKDPIARRANPEE